MSDSRIDQMLAKLREARRLGHEENDMGSRSHELSIAITEIESAILRLVSLQLGEAVFGELPKKKPDAIQ